eukprot:TRINITY_DN4629_c0_g4_i1.p1 TRINITY_DN4629_c0_g4~~TRINITY_DN4629_c0_g4_i1.p1  ORF type:complete len:108 (+),score=22.39 TRINITY_DN4629_c0_g4_i1:37-360(+)
MLLSSTLVRTQFASPRNMCFRSFNTSPVTRVESIEDLRRRFYADQKEKTLIKEIESEDRIMQKAFAEIREEKRLRGIIDPDDKQEEKTLEPKKRIRKNFYMKNKKKR